CHAKPVCWIQLPIRDLSTGLVWCWIGRRQSDLPLHVVSRTRRVRVKLHLWLVVPDVVWVTRGQQGFWRFAANPCREGTVRIVAISRRVMAKRYTILGFDFSMS